MKYAPFLKPEGRIGFVAPSFGCNIEPYRSAFENALKTFRNMGYTTVLGPNCYEGSGIGISNTPEACAKELMEYYTADDNHVLISCGGGELMCEVLDHMDFDRIRKTQPKWYMGFSDNTNMTFLLATIADTASLYGPCAAAFGMEPWHPALKDAFDILCGNGKNCAVNAGKTFVLRGYDKWERVSVKDEEHPLAPYQVTEQSVLRYYAPDCMEPVLITNQPAAPVEAQKEITSFSGRLLGGCVDCLVNLLGTRFDHVQEFQKCYADDGILWYLECCDLNVMSIRRAMWQMKNAGWFQYVKGFLIGRPLCHGQEMFGLDQYHAVIDILKDYQVPVVMDLDIGHIPPMMPIICGSMGDVTLYENGMTLAMHCE